MQTTVYIENFEEFLQKDSKDIKTDCFANSKPNKKRKKVTFEEGENVFYEDLELVLAAGLSRPGKSREGPRTGRDRTGPRDLEGPVVPWSQD